MLNGHYSAIVDLTDKHALSLKEIEAMHVGRMFMFCSKAVHGSLISSVQESMCISSTSTKCHLSIVSYCVEEIVLSLAHGRQSLSCLSAREQK